MCANMILRFPWVVVLLLTEAGRAGAAHSKREAANEAIQFICALQRMVNVSLRRQGDAVGAGKLDKRYKSCAIVSNSGVLALHKHGPAIDKADLVIRFNDASMEGFEPQVGSREDIRFVNDQALIKIAADLPTFLKDSTFVVVPMKATRGMSHLAPSRASMNKISDTYLLEPETLQSFSKAMDTFYEDAWFASGMEIVPTSGAAGMLVALNLCEEIRAYGMAETSQAAAAPYHYYEPDAPKLNAEMHASFDAEKDFWTRIASNSAEDIDASEVAVMSGFSDAQCVSSSAAAFHEIPFPISEAKKKMHLAWASTLAMAVLPFAFLSFLVLRFAVQVPSSLEVHGYGSVPEPEPTESSQSRCFGLACEHTSVIIYVLVLWTHDGLLQIYGGQYPSEPAMLVFWAEVLKVVASLLLHRLDQEGRHTVSCVAWLEVVGRQLPVAAAYACNVYVVLYWLRNVHMSLFVEWRNAAILFNATLWCLCFRQRLWRHQILGCVGVLMGCWLLQFRQDGVFVSGACLSLARAYPVLIILLSVALSGTAAVLNEHTMKCKNLMAEIGINRLNIVLYSETSILIILLMRGLKFQASPAESRFGFDSFCLACSQALLGLAASRVLLHCDSVGKAVAGSTREIAVIILSAFGLGRTHSGWISVGASVWIGLGLSLYFLYPNTSRQRLLGEAACHATVEKSV